MRYPHTVHFLRNEVPFSLLKTPKPHVFRGFWSSKCPKFGKMWVKIHNCNVLLHLLPVFGYTAHMLLFSRISPALVNVYFEKYLFLSNITCLTLIWTQLVCFINTFNSYLPFFWIEALECLECKTWVVYCFWNIGKIAFCLFFKLYSTGNQK